MLSKLIFETRVVLDFCFFLKLRTAKILMYLEGNHNRCEIAAFEQALLKALFGIHLSRPKRPKIEKDHLRKCFLNIDCSTLFVDVGAILESRPLPKKSQRILQDRAETPKISVLSVL